MPRKYRKARMIRRRERWVNTEHQNGLYTTVALFAFAALFVSFSRILFKVSSSAFIPALNVGLVGLCLMCFAMFCIWSHYVDRQKMGVLVLCASIAFGAAIWSAGKYIPLSKMATSVLSIPPENPMNIKLPSLPQYREGRWWWEAQGLLSIGPQDIWLNRIPVNGPEDLENKLKIYDDRKRQQVEILGQEYYPKYLLLAADKCTSFGTINDFSNVKGRYGNVRALFWSSTKLETLHFSVSKYVHVYGNVVFELTNTGVDAFVDGQRIDGPNDCPSDGPAFCASEDKTDCNPNWDVASFRSSLAESLDEKHCENPMFTVIVSADISHQKMLSLISTVISSKKGEGMPCLNEVVLVLQDTYSAGLVGPKSE